MSEKLLESDFITVDLRSVFNPTAAATSSGNNDTSGNSEENVDKELVTKLKKLKFPDEIISKLLSFGDPFKKVCTTLGFKLKNEKGGNPILAFVYQPWVQKELITPGLLNTNTFKAIYNAVAKHLVADSEFFEARNYNIIYCPDLYRKSAREIEEYLKLQRSILSPSADSYEGKKQLRNRQLFLVNPENSEELNNNKVPVVYSAKLKGLKEVVELINNNKAEKAGTINRSNDELIEISKKLTSLPEKLAAILSLSMSTSSKKAQKALSNEQFAAVDSRALTKAFLKLSSTEVLPKGQLQAKSADTLVELILAALDSESNE